MPEATLSAPGHRVAALAVVAGLFLAGNVNAATASGNAWDLDVRINVIGLSTLNVQPVTQVQFDDETLPYADSATQPSLDVGNNVLGLSTGVLQSEVAWAPGEPMMVGAQSSVADVKLTALGLLGGSLITLNTDLALSRVLLSGQCPPPGAGVTSIPGLVDDRIFANGFDTPALQPVEGDSEDPDLQLPGLELELIGIPINIPLTFPPNTVIDLSQLGLAGITLIINEVNIQGDGVNHLWMERNALRLSLNVLGLIRGDVTLAHAEAGIDCTTP